MGFDAKDFNRAKFKPRTEAVKVPELQAFFGDGDPVWEVRGLTGEEMCKVRAAGEAQRSRVALIEALSAGGLKEQTEAIKELIGASDTLPEDYVRRIEMLLLASTDPIDRQTVVKLATAYPVTLHTLTDTILKLTGLGQDPGKLPGSGKSRASATP